MKTAIVLLLLILFAGCASYRPMVDTKGVDMNRYEADVGECQQYAQRTAGAGTGAVAGATGGALAGYVLARIVGASTNVNMKAGAFVGAASGAVQGARNEMEVIKQCMRGRGYSVLQ